MSSVDVVGEIKSEYAGLPGGGRLADLKRTLNRLLE
jgi:hypothetical protein